ncbi:hypothetical protein H6G17_07125 [Chroococcidiopsis sp. FACHB-1243]|nr:hypothetical protein [Chroococcidiopsis sp. [FACHB-1243]]MBD2305284.1 hypothetical protein [Chroococcidiopsis sp. [FACHB-1243]]
MFDLLLGSREQGAGSRGNKRAEGEKNLHPTPYTLFLSAPRTTLLQMTDQ